MRTTVPAVQSIFDADQCVDPRPFIITASALVDWLVGKDTAGELSTTLQERIECWLAAHFYEHHNRTRQYNSLSQNRASGTYQGQTAMVLMSTKYGQTACALDVTNRLAERSKEAETGLKRKIGVQWLGYSTDSSRPDGLNANP